MDATTDAVELAYTMSADDIRHGTRARTRSSRTGRFVLALFPVAAVLIAVALVLYAVLAIVGELELDAFRGLIPVAVTVAALGLVLLLQRWVHAQLAKQLGNLRASIDDQGVRITNEHSSTVSEWPAYGSYVETDQVFVLLSPDKRRLVFTVLPKRGLAGEADARRLRAILARHLG